eukprot:7381394-Prymnesium_polylepis.2
MPALQGRTPVRDRSLPRAQQPAMATAAGCVPIVRLPDAEAEERKGAASQLLRCRVEERELCADGHREGLSLGDSHAVDKRNVPLVLVSLIHTWPSATRSSQWCELTLGWEMM